jgi:hypothetical protein
MNYTRIYADAHGDSYFETVDVPLNNQGAVGCLSTPIKVNELFLRENEPNYDWDFHTAPARQFIVLLDGEIEIETSLGDKRRFKGGDILLVEDVTGKGHRTKNIQQAARRSLFILFSQS